jgi:hypothetical protein
MRGAPHVGFSAAMRKIRARISLLNRLRPPSWLALEKHVQYNRKPARCQLTTVLGVTKIRGRSHSDHRLRKPIQNSLCRVVIRRRHPDGISAYHRHGYPVSPPISSMTLSVISTHSTNPKLIAQACTRVSHPPFARRQVDPRLRVLVLPDRIQGV